MKINTSEEEFLKIKKFRIESKNIKTKKQTMKKEIKFKKENCKKSYICEIKYD